MEKKDHKSIEVIDEDGKRPPQQQQQRPPPCPGLSGERGGRRQQMQHAPAQHVYHLIVDGVRLEEVIHSPQCIWTYQYNGAPFGDIIRKRWCFLQSMTTSNYSRRARHTKDARLLYLHQQKFGSNINSARVDLEGMVLFSINSRNNNKVVTKECCSSLTNYSYMSLQMGKQAIFLTREILHLHGSITTHTCYRSKSVFRTKKQSVHRPPSHSSTKVEQWKE